MHAMKEKEKDETEGRQIEMIHVNKFILADFIIYGTLFSLSLENELTWDDSDWGSWDNPEGKEDGAQVCITDQIWSKMNIESFQMYVFFCRKQKENFFNTAHVLFSLQIFLIMITNINGHK